jgi:EAL and modified HD-GYP domain-containing signal transduction protein
MRSEVFICGVFSLLDRMFGEPFAKLLSSIPVPERVYQALVKSEGPFQPYLAMVRAAEGESVFEYREAAEQLLMSVAEINRAQLRALQGAAALE